MNFDLKEYDKYRRYIEYSDIDSNLFFNNAVYFIFEVMSDEYKELMSHTGGFVANVTTRFIIEKNLDCA